MDVFQGKRGSKVKINIENFDIASGDLVMVFEDAPSYSDLKALFSNVPFCPISSSATTKNKKKNQRQKKKSQSNSDRLVSNIRQNQIFLGFEFIAVSLISYTIIWSGSMTHVHTNTVLYSIG